MNKKEYMDQLENGLSSMSYKDVKEILGEIEEHFSVGIANGKTEDEICNDLGSADELAKAYIEGTSLPQALIKKPVYETPKTTVVENKNYDLAGVLFVIFFNLIVMLPVWISVLGFVLALVGIELALIGGLIGLILAIPSMGTFIATGIVLALLLLFIVVFAFVLCYFAVKYFFVGTAAYIKWNKKVWKQGF